MVVSSKVSENIGKTVPHRVTKAINKNKTFWARNADSLEMIDSRRPRLFRVSYLITNMTSDTNKVKPMTAKKIHPIVDSANE